MIICLTKIILPNMYAFSADRKSDIYPIIDEKGYIVSRSYLMKFFPDADQVFCFTGLVSQLNYSDT